MTIQRPVRAAFEVPGSAAARQPGVREQRSVRRRSRATVSRLDGSGAPGDTAYREAMSALYPAPPAISRVRVEAVKEGQCVQMLHVGAYNAEVPTLERLHKAMAQAGLRPHGAHHEIYISDPNRTPPQRLKTVIRQPVAEAAAS